MSVAEKILKQIQNQNFDNIQPLVSGYLKLRYGLTHNKAREAWINDQPEAAIFLHLLDQSSYDQKTKTPDEDRILQLATNLLNTKPAKAPKKKSAEHYCLRFIPNPLTQAESGPAYVPLVAETVAVGSCRCGGSRCCSGWASRRIYRFIPPGCRIVIVITHFINDAPNTAAPTTPIATAVPTNTACGTGTRAAPPLLPAEPLVLPASAADRRQQTTQTNSPAQVMPQKVDFDP
ncbi:MAG: hypothetical protein CM15mP120_03240 [Pseudomonadota bacterium]|nr:MAG: hypothetical protein CM15mP120_03240 [Pseudomonadota bacterium]